MKSKLINKKKSTHSPNLETIIMVEQTMKNAENLMKISELKRRLPRKVMHQTLIQILDYLQQSGKIIVGTKGVLWVFTERKELNLLINKGLEI